MKRSHTQSQEPVTSGTETPQPDAKPTTADKDKLYWQKKRKQVKEKQKEKKNASLTKEEYLQTEQHKNNLEKMRAREKWRNKPIEEITFSHPQVAVDLSYGADMTSKSIASTVTQLNHLYGALRKSDRPLKTHLCSYTGEFQTKLEIAGVAGWKVFPHAEPYYSVFDPSEIIYLSPDSPNILEKIDETKVYIIGGLADHNHLTGLSNKRASAREIQTAKLPLTTYLQDFPNKSLNVNHVFEIIMDVANDGDWKKALEKHVPQRKGFKKLKQKQKTPKPDQTNTVDGEEGVDKKEPVGDLKAEVDTNGDGTQERRTKRRKVDTDEQVITS